MKKSIIAAGIFVVILLIITGIIINRKYFTTNLIKILGKSKSVERHTTIYAIVMGKGPYTADEKCAENLPKTCTFTGVIKKEIVFPDTVGGWDDQYYNIICSYKCLCIDLDIIDLGPIGEYCKP